MDTDIVKLRIRAVDAQWRIVGLENDQTVTVNFSANTVPRRTVRGSQHATSKQLDIDLAFASTNEARSLGQKLIEFADKADANG